MGVAPRGEGGGGEKAVLGREGQDGSMPVPTSLSKVDGPG